MILDLIPFCTLPDVASLARLQYTFCFKLFNFFSFLRVDTDY